MRHTRIIATVGPASDSPEVLDALIETGVEIFRLNFSHGTQETQRAAFDNIREAASRAGRLVAVLQDLSGPKIRTGRLASGAPLPLHPGETLRIVTGDGEGGPGVVYTTYGDLAPNLHPGQELLLDDGRIVLRVESTAATEIRTTVVHGSSLGEHKGINAPGVALPSAGLTAKDADDLRFGVQLGVDMMALSFVQTGDDLRAARRALEEAGGRDVPLVAKLERPEAIARLDEILQLADAVMVARGDLGLEMPLEQVPRVQKEITRQARTLGRPVIVATQVLESMRHEPRPTRAEVSDAANAVDDGVDGIMLAGETAAGRYPVRATRVLDAVIRDAERLPSLAVPPVGTLMHAEHGRALCEAALTLADHERVEAIVAVTRGGNTARMLACLRPSVPVLAATDRLEVARRLLLYRGVVPVIAPLGDDVDVTGQRVARALQERALLKKGDEIVFVSVHDDLEKRGVNFLKLHRL